ncbi:putative protein kinase (incomplete catalytic triad) [Neospora caninum Liverpool]|uniref:Protein kinase (Incomplete catalytic triad),putative n=1 Tax=Neospora caninum (strain Liverpool) TaxID=572307 RepID=F0VA97_NEOCL|nr:putative protein kinase (incomplete catalytic triad) [Neospora caninum Liverpool]CBZ50586.1 putative protein kinase (incomplete catalytic triad) [Neospora caninum Liverpool]CEL65199.1 TPA: protein kinase (incomplete catalytic triad),putative [Neospora caninum Liverpool]|eukprot:XP_003880619.1 putative protein kinase (incomplete catalytic triad) [Neospora caninum Liverpool]
MRIGTDATGGGTGVESEDNGSDGPSWTLVASKRRGYPRTPRGAGPASAVLSRSSRPGHSSAARRRPEQGRSDRPLRPRRPPRTEAPHLGSPPTPSSAAAVGAGPAEGGVRRGAGDTNEQTGKLREPVKEHWPELGVVAQAGAWGERAPQRTTASWATVAAGCRGDARAPPGQAMRACPSRPVGREAPRPGLARGPVQGAWQPPDETAPRSVLPKASMPPASSAGQESSREGLARSNQPQAPRALGPAVSVCVGMGRGARGWGVPPEPGGETRGGHRGAGDGEGRMQSCSEEPKRETAGASEATEPKPHTDATAASTARPVPTETKEKAPELRDPKRGDAAAKRGQARKGDARKRETEEARLQGKPKEGAPGGPHDDRAGGNRKGETKRPEDGACADAPVEEDPKSVSGKRPKAHVVEASSSEAGVQSLPSVSSSSPPQSHPAPDSTSLGVSSTALPLLPGCCTRSCAAENPPEDPAPLAAPRTMAVGAAPRDSEKADVCTPQEGASREERETEAGHAQPSSCERRRREASTAPDERRAEGARVHGKAGTKPETKGAASGKEATSADGRGDAGASQGQKGRDGDGSARSASERPSKEATPAQGESQKARGGRNADEQEAHAAPDRQNEETNRSQDHRARESRFKCQCKQGDSGTEEQGEDEVRAMDAMYTPVKILQPGFLSSAFLAELHDPLLDFFPPSPHAPLSSTEELGSPSSETGVEPSAGKKDDAVLVLPTEFLSGKKLPVSPALQSRLGRPAVSSQAQAQAAKAEHAVIFNLRRCPWIITLSVSGSGFCALSADESEAEEPEETEKEPAKVRGLSKRRAATPPSSPAPSMRPPPSPDRAPSGTGSARLPEASAGAAQTAGGGDAGRLSPRQRKAHETWTATPHARDPLSHSSLSTAADFPSVDASLSSRPLSPSSCPSVPASSSASRSPVSSPAPDGPPASCLAAQETRGPRDPEIPRPRCQLCLGDCDVECVRYLFRVLSETQQAFFAIVDVLLPRNYPAAPPYVAVGLSAAVPRKELEQLRNSLREEYEASRGEVVLYRLCLQLQSFMAELSSTLCFSNLWEEMHFKERQRRHFLLREQHMIHRNMKARQGLLSHPFGPSGLVQDGQSRRGFPFSSRANPRLLYGHGSSASLTESCDGVLDGDHPGNESPVPGHGGPFLGAHGSNGDLSTAVGGSAPGRRVSRDDERGGGLAASTGTAHGNQFGGRLAALDRFGERRGENAFTFQAAVKARMRQVLDDRRQELFDKESSLLYSRKVGWAADDESAFYWDDEDDEDESVGLDHEDDIVDIQSSFYASSPSQSRRRTPHRHWVSQFRRCRSAATAQPSPPPDASGLHSADADPSDGSRGKHRREAPPTLQAPPGAASEARGDTQKTTRLKRERPQTNSARTGPSTSAETQEAKTTHDGGAQTASGALGSTEEAREGAAAGPSPSGGDSPETGAPANGLVPESAAAAGGSSSGRGGSRSRRGGSLRSLLLSSQRTTRYQRDFIQLEVLGVRDHYRIALVYHIIDKHKYIVKQVFIPCGPVSPLARQAPAGSEGQRRRKQLQGLELVESALQQVTLLCALQHPYIMRYHQAWTQYHATSSPLVTNSQGGAPDDLALADSRGDPEPEVDVEREEPCIGVYIQMEFCERSLEDEIEKRTVLHWDSQQIWTLFRQTLEALVYIHRNRVCHVSLKPSNVFLEPDAYGYNVKLGDFGVTSLFDIVHNTHSPISRLYTAPELLSTADGKSSSLTMRDADKADMYSLGVLFAEMWGRHEMFGRSCSRTEFLTSLVKERNLQQLNVPSAAVKIIKQLLSPNPADRPSSMTLLQSSLLPPAVEEELFKAFLLRLRTQVQNPSCASLPLRDASPSPTGRKKTEPAAKKRNLDKTRNSLATGGASPDDAQAQRRNTAPGLAGEVLKIFFRRQFDSASATLFFNDFLKRSNTAPEPETRCVVQRILAEFFARCGADEVQIPLLVPLTKGLAACEEAIKQTPTHASSHHSESLSLLDQRNVLLTLPRFFTSALCACGDVGAFPLSLHSSSLTPSPEAALLALQSPSPAAPVSTCPFCGGPSPASASPLSSLSSSFAHSTLLSSPPLPLPGRAGRAGDDADKCRDKLEDAEPSRQGREYRRFCVGHCYTAPTVSFLASYGHPLPYFSACFQLLVPSSPVSETCHGSPSDRRSYKTVSAAENPVRSSSPSRSSSRLVLSPEEQRTALAEAEILSVCGGALRAVQTALALPLGWRVSWTLGSLMPAILREFFFVPLSDLANAMALLRHARPSETGTVPDSALQKAVERLIEYHSVLPFAERPRFAETLKSLAKADGASVREVVAQLFSVFSELHSRMQGDAVLSKLSLLLSHRPLAPRPLLLQLLSSSSSLAAAGSTRAPLLGERQEGDAGAASRDKASPSGKDDSREKADTRDEDAGRTSEAFLAGEVGRLLVRALYIERTIGKSGEDTRPFLFRVFLPGDFRPFDAMGLLFQASVGTAPFPNPSPSFASSASSSSSSSSSSSHFEGIPVGDGGFLLAWAWSGQEARGGRASRHAAAIPFSPFASLSSLSQRSVSAALKRRGDEKDCPACASPPSGFHTLSFELALERILSFSSLVRHLHGIPALCELSAHLLPSFTLPLGFSSEANAAALRLAATLTKTAAAPPAGAATEAMAEPARDGLLESEDEAALPQVVVTAQSAKHLPLGFSLVCKLLRRGVRAELRVSPVVETSYFQRLLRRSRRILYHVQIQHHRASVSSHAAIPASHASASLCHHETVSVAGAPPGFSSALDRSRDVSAPLPAASAPSGWGSREAAALLRGESGVHGLGVSLKEEPAASLLATGGASGGAALGLSSFLGGGLSAPHSHLGPSVAAGAFAAQNHLATGALFLPPLACVPAAYVVEELHASCANGERGLASVFFSERKKQKLFNEGAVVQLLCTALVEGYNVGGEKGSGGKKQKKGGAGERGGESEFGRQPKGGKERR